MEQPEAGAGDKEWGDEAGWTLGLENRERQKGQSESGVPRRGTVSLPQLPNPTPGPPFSDHTCDFRQIKNRDLSVNGEGLGI